MLANVGRGPDPFVGARWRHADVGDNHVGLLGVDQRDERVEVAAGADHVDALLALEQADDALTHEQRVVRQHDPSRH